MSESNKPLALPLSVGLGPALVPCPMCDEHAGYDLREGSTFRWWAIACASCGREIGECRSNTNSPTREDRPDRWELADAEWNAAGAHAESLREALRRLRAWGGFGHLSYSASVAFGVIEWIDAGMQGELPDLPDFAKRGPNAAGKAPAR